MPSEIDMSTLDITKQNVAVEKVLERTTNPRHRHLLQAYLRHRYLESAGRWEEIFDPAMTVDHPIYRFNLKVLVNKVTSEYAVYRSLTTVLSMAFITAAVAMGVALLLLR